MAEPRIDETAGDRVWVAGEEIELWNGFRRNGLLRLGEDVLEVAAGFGVGHLGEAARRADCDDFPTAVTRAGAEVDEPVCALDEIEVVFDQEDGVACVDELVEDAEEVGAVFEGESCGRFV